MVISISNREILLYCNTCGKVVYKADRVAIPLLLPNIPDFYPTIQETHKVFCEKCCMAFMLKIKELELEIEKLKVAIRQKRVKKHIDKYVLDSF